MGKYPKPEGFKGGGQDASILRTLDGHIAMDPFDTEPMDPEVSRNERSFEEADLGGEDYC